MGTTDYAQLGVAAEASDSLESRTAEAAAPASQLKRRVTGAVFWLGAARVFNRAQSALKGVLIARLLTPADYGEYTIVLLTALAVDTLTQTSFFDALIYEKNPDRAALDTSWTIQLLRGFVLGLLMLGVAALTGARMGNPRLTRMIAATGLQLFFFGFENIGIVYFQKDLEFRKQFTFHTLVGTVSFGAALVAAWILRSAWALVISSIAMALARVVLSFVLQPYRPRLRISRESFQGLFHFSKWVTANSLVAFLAQRLDQLMLARFFPLSTLGSYQMANTLAMTLPSECSAVTLTLGFPLYVECGVEQARKWFLRSLAIIAAVMMPAATFIMVHADGIVDAVLGPKWKEAALPLAICSVAAIISAIDTAWAPLLLSRGMPKQELMRSLARVTTLLVCVVPLTRSYGTAGTAAALCLSVASSTPFWLMAARRVHVDLARSLTALVPGVVLAGAVVLAGIPARLAGSVPGRRLALDCLSVICTILITLRGMRSFRRYESCMTVTEACSEVTRGMRAATLAIMESDPIRFGRRAGARFTARAARFGEE